MNPPINLLLLHVLLFLAIRWKKSEQTVQKTGTTNMTVNSTLNGVTNVYFA